MSYLIIPKDYKPLLDLKQTELGIKKVKEFFQQNLSSELRLRRVTAPLFVLKGTGLNDDLNGVERAVTFPIKDLNDANWEQVITAEQRNLVFLKSIVRRIYAAMLRTEYMVCENYPQIEPFLAPEVFFIHSEELRRLYPDNTPKEREMLITKEHKAVFIMGIGGNLEDGKPHDLRAPDYDDYSSANEDGYHGLNGDLLVWDDILECPIELSSMGIRVDKEALLRQLALSGKEERKELYFHKRLIEGSLPLSIGGGIGQSRLCMIYLRKAHIGEIQASIWPEEMRQTCAANNIPLI